jgi:FAD synthase
MSATLLAVAHVLQLQHEIAMEHIQVEWLDHARAKEIRKAVDRRVSQG